LGVPKVLFQTDRFRKIWPFSRSTSVCLRASSSPSRSPAFNAEKAAKQALYGFLSDLLTVEQWINYFPVMEPDADARIRELEARLRE